MPLAVVFGGTGFLGRQLVRQLARRGWRVRVGTRNPDLAGAARVQGDPGQVEPVAVDIRSPAAVRAALAGADAAVNLVGILHEGGGRKFAAIHADGAATVAETAAALGIGTLVHVSAIGAAADSASLYARTKAEGERRVAAHPGAVILRPSVIFGEGDRFFCRFARMAVLAPVIPLVGADTRFQPVHVEDVAAAAARLLQHPEAGGLYELGGPRVYSFRELMECMLRSIRRRRLLLPLPFMVARNLAAVLALLPDPPLTPDQVRLLGRDNVVSPEARGFAALGIMPTALEGVIDTYLVPYRPGGQYYAITARS